MTPLTYEKIKLLGRLELHLEQATEEGMRKAIVAVMFAIRKQVLSE